MDPTPFLHAAAERKLLELPLTVAELGGNRDRRPELERTHLHVRDASGREVKITIGHCLDAIRQRAALFHAALPYHAANTLFFFSIQGVDVWAQEWISGPNFEEHPLTGAASAARTIVALETLEHALESTATNSSWHAWQQEFDGFSRAVLDLPIWEAGEASALEQMLPQLADRLRSSATPKQRWSNGDFLSTNIKLNPEEKPVLLDFEYGSRTHFFSEDHIRFHRLSPIAQMHPGLFAGIWPEVTAAWELFFELRQLTLEVAVNTPGYLSRVIPNRKAHVRSAAERLGFSLPSWPAAAPTVPVHAQETIQLFWEVAGNWSEANSKRIEIRRGQLQFIAFRLPPNTPNFRLDPAFSARSVHLKSLHALDQNGSLISLLEHVTPVGTEIAPAAEGIWLSPHHADPQLLINLTTRSSFLIAKILVSENE